MSDSSNCIRLSIRGLLRGAMQPMYARMFLTASSTYAQFAQAYYASNAARKNLVVLTGATVTKITFRPGSSPAHATGVEFLHDDNKHHVKVIKEVILSAGELLSSVVDVELGIEQRIL